MAHTINCEHCGHEIDVDKALSKKISSQYEEREKILEANKKRQKEIIDYKVKELTAAWEEKALIKSQYLKDEAKALKDQAVKARQDQDAIIKSKVREKELAFRRSIKKEMDDAFRSEMQEAANKDAENNKLKVANMKLESRMKTLESIHKSDTDVKVIEARNEAIKKANEEKELIQLEHEEKMKQMQKSLKDANRQVNQGSMQIQGEAQEKSIEDFLKYTFPIDVVEPIKQGALGADCLQYVKTNNNQSCGTIYYESKRTKEFSPAWIEKLKVDMRAKNVDIGVLATQTMPKDMERAGFVKGIWICSLNEFKTISCILRKQLIEIHKVRNIGENRKDIASHLYRYLTSSEFKMDMEAIVEGFTDMKLEIDSEKRAMNRMWSKREKHLEKIMMSTVSMYGSLQGISDNSIETVKGLEFPNADYGQIEECESA